MPRNGSPRPSRRFIAIAGCLLVAAIVLGYANTLWVPFAFDDFGAIVQNPTIRHLWPLADVLTPPHHLGSTVGGRPLLNLSLALNYALSGESVWSYHLLNLAIHVGGALLLFGICRRTLSLARWADSNLLGFAITALWALHPLQTEAVTYLSQRAESLASFFYLLAVYAFCRAVNAGGARTVESASEAGAARGPDPASIRRWLACSAIACLLGVASKEIVVTAPVLVLLYDRTFVSGSFTAAWRARRGYYVALAASWLLVAALALSTENRGDTAGFGTGVSVWAYLLTQAFAIIHYLRLVFWPTNLVFDYGPILVRGLVDVWLHGLAVLALLAASVACLTRQDRPPRSGAGRGVAQLGFLGVAFFLLLAPSSSFVPVGSQTIAEHRMYLPLAALAGLAGVLAHRWLGRRGVVWLLILAVVDGALAYRRNDVYHTDLALWSDTVAHAPGNARARNNLGDALISRGRFAAALPQYEAAVTFEPDYADAQSNLGRVLVVLRRAAEALPHTEIAVKLNPQSADVWTNYGLTLAQVDRRRAAIAAFEKALQLSPTALDARYDLGNVYYQLGEYAMAVAQYEKALQLQPERHDARFNLAFALLRLNRPQDALAQFERLLRHDPNDAGAHVETGNILAYFGRTAEAIAHFETALRLQPDLAVAREKLQQLRSTPAAPRR